MRVIWSAPARADLRSIDRWLTHNTDAVSAVDQLAAIRARADLLVVAPMSGLPFAGDQRILVVPHTPYLIRYRLREHAVDVLRVHHGRQNWRART